MRKVIKILGKVISATILLLIILPLSLSLLLDLPSVQNYAVDHAASLASRSLGTTVSIDRVDIGLFNRVRIKGFYVEDFQGDTLLYVKRLKANISSFGLMGGGVTLRRGDVSGVKLNIVESPDSVMNIKEVVNRLSDPNREKKGNFSLTIKSLNVDSLDFRLERLAHRNPEYGIDFGNMAMLDTKAKISDFNIAGSAITMQVESFKSHEQSGFYLDELVGRVYIDKGLINVTDTKLRTRLSSVEVPSLTIAGDDWFDFKYFVDSVALEGSLRRTTLSSDDVAYFSPKLRKWHLRLYDIDCKMQGLVSDFYADIARLRTGDDTSLSVKGSITGLPDIKTTSFDLNVLGLNTSAEDVRMVSSSIAGANLSEGLVAMVSRAGELSLSGEFRGSLAEFASHAALRTEIGRADLNLRMRPAMDSLHRDNHYMMGNIAVNNLDLGELLGSNMLGRTSLYFHLDGDVGRKGTVAAVNGKIAKLEFNGYKIDSVRLDGHLYDREFDGHVRARNKALDFDFNGLIALKEGLPEYDFCLNLTRADLAALGINKRDSVSTLRAHIDALGSGRTLDDLNGSITVEDAQYIHNADTVVSSMFRIDGNNTPESKSIRLVSDIADVSFTSRESYQDAFRYFRHCLRSYIPNFFGDKSEDEQADDVDLFEATGDSATISEDNYSILKVDVKNFNPVANAISGGLQVADSTNLYFMFDPHNDRFTLTAESDYIERRRMLATKIKLNASNHGDSLSLFVNSADIYAGAFYVPNPSVMCGAKDNRVYLSAGFRDTLHNSTARVGVRADILRDSAVGRKIQLYIQPSVLTRGEKSWRIISRRIEIDSSRIVVGGLRLTNDEQNLQIEGIASRSREDSITLTLKNFDLGPFTPFVQRMGYTINGTTNGFATVKSALSGAEITARINLDSIRVNDIQSPALLLDSRWDFEQSRARFFVKQRIKGDTLVRGYYSPRRGRYYARLDVDSLEMGLLDPVLKGVISGTEGLAHAELVMTGANRDAELKGEIRVTGLKTKVDYTQAVYSAPLAVINVTNNRLSASNVRLFDEERNSGLLDLELNLSHLSNISYDVRVRPENMIVLSTTAKDNNLFYGKVYASGSASIVGDKSGVRMNIVATTDDNSSFNMPLSGKANISRAEFVKFVTSSQRDTTNYLVRKRMMFERKRKERSSGGNLDINLALNVLPNTEVQLLIDPAVGDVIKAEGEGMLSLHINPRNNIFEMTGDYTIQQGEYMFTLADVIKRPFTIENGSTIIWTGEPLDAMLNINAVYTVKTSLAPLTDELTNQRSVPVNCIIHITDRLTNPEVSFDIEVPSAESETQTSLANVLNTQESIARQVMYLLVFNSFVSETGASAAGLGATATTATGFQLLSNQLSNMLSGEEYDIIFRYRPKSETTGTGDELDFGFSKSLINERLLIEVEGNYIVDNRSATNAQQMSSFMGEAYITWLIDRAGTLRLKGFTQNIDRFDENQGLQETGIGIYYKEDFNNLRDFRRRVRERFMSKKKREKLEAERMAQRLSEIRRNRESSGEEQPVGEEDNKTESLNDNRVERKQ